MLKKIKKIAKSSKPSPKKEKPQKSKEPSKSSKNKSSGATKDRHQMVQEAAYYRAEKRNFLGGDPLEDWIAAEAEIEMQNTMS